MRKELVAAIKALPDTAGNGTRAARCVCSTESIDRQGDVVVQAGWQLQQYRQNPVVLFAHDSTKPIAHCSDIGVVANRLEATITFPPPGASSTSDWAWAMIQANALKAVSVGFTIGAATPIPGGRGSRITSATLLELSIVSVPANADALIVGTSGAKEHPQAARLATLDALKRSQPQPMTIEAARAVIGKLKLAGARAELAAIKRSSGHRTLADRKAEVEALKVAGRVRKQISSCDREG